MSKIEELVRSHIIHMRKAFSTFYANFSILPLIYFDYRKNMSAMVGSFLSFNLSNFNYQMKPFECKDKQTHREMAS